MSVELVIPSMGESVKTAIISRWLKKPGDTVQADEPIVSVDSDKATAELPSPASGVVEALLAAEGDEVAIGQVIARIREGGAEVLALAAPGEPGPIVEAGPAGPAVRQALRDAGVDVTDVRGSGRGGRITRSDVASSVLSTAADPGRAAGGLFGMADGSKPRRQPRSGTERLVALGYTEQQVLRMDVDTKHAILDGRIAAADAPADLGSLTPASRPAQPEAPAVPRPALASVALAPVAPPEPAPTTLLSTTDVGDEPVEIVPMTNLRRRIAERLLEAQSTAAILTTFNEVDMTAVMALRERYQERFSKKHGIKLGFMSFFVKAAIEALKAFPAANAEIRGTDIVYKHYFHVGVAVSGPRGLVVPVVRHADRLSFAETEQAIAAFGRRAQDGKITVDDLQGGTFTISNGGTFGSMMSTPILNPPQVAILGMHAITKRAVVISGPEGDQIVVRPMMYLALSYDHRLLDGREAVQTLVRIKECVENPERILLEI